MLFVYSKLIQNIDFHINAIEEHGILDFLYIHICIHKYKYICTIRIPSQFYHLCKMIILFFVCRTNLVSAHIHI